MRASAESKNKHEELAKEVVLHGRSFRSAAVMLGYSQAYADNGPKSMRSKVPSLNRAFNKAEQLVEWQPDVLKRAAVNRIATTCLDDRNSDNLRAAELIGKFKSVDLFVRNGEAQVGIFLGGLESNDAEMNAILPAETAEKSE